MYKKELHQYVKLHQNKFIESSMDRWLPLHDISDIIKTGKIRITIILMSYDKTLDKQHVIMK